MSAGTTMPVETLDPAFFRDQQGLEVDYIVPGVSRAVQLVEAKATATAATRMAVPMRRLADAFKKRGSVPRRVTNFGIRVPFCYTSFIE